MPPDVDAVTVSGPWLRHTPAAADLAVRPQPPDDNRWQRGRVVDALYLADDRDTAWAEWYRHLAERGLPPHVALPRELWTVTVTGLVVADLRGPAGLERLGLTLPAPSRRTWPPFQAVGERLHAQGWPGLLAPSAARPDGHILCVFLPLAGSAARLDVTGREAIRMPPAPRQACARDRHRR